MHQITINGAQVQTISSQSASSENAARKSGVPEYTCDQRARENAPKFGMQPEPTAQTNKAQAGHISRAPNISATNAVTVTPIAGSAIRDCP
ncbi:hypothetical protein AXK12_01055 [Cephaloticoccus capnophilus]|uniref:Uncharacterized protein n=1 Tax=Cephaloticoccus capnophilus TaxID=1548208 RepID=A0A139STT2_9BACT|nr:hypothetical protein AXK12_01055 [Cephaloticoccus capnophilus]